MRGQRLSPKTRNAILPLYEEGLSRNAIALQLGIAHTSVSRVLRKAGIEPENRVLRGAEHGRWKGGREVDRDGYVRVTLPSSHPFASEMRNVRGQVFEHRLVMAEYLGRPLERRETVHHINGVRDDNRLENLQLRIGPHGIGAAYRCADCGSANLVAQEIDTWSSSRSTAE